MPCITRVGTRFWFVFYICYLHGLTSIQCAIFWNVSFYLIWLLFTAKCFVVSCVNCMSREFELVSLEGSKTNIYFSLKFFFLFGQNTSRFRWRTNSCRPFASLMLCNSSRQNINLLSTDLIKFPVSSDIWYRSDHRTRDVTFWGQKIKNKKSTYCCDVRFCCQTGIVPVSYGNLWNSFQTPIASSKR